MLRELKSTETLVVFGVAYDIGDTCSEQYAVLSPRWNYCAFTCEVSTRTNDRSLGDGFKSGAPIDLH